MKPYLIVLGFLIVVLTGTAVYNSSAVSKLLPQVRICVPKSPASALVVIADELRFFEREGVRATVEIAPSSDACIKALTEKRVDMAASTVSPAVSALTKGQRFVITSELQNSSRCIGIVYKSGGTITQPEDLLGKSIALVRGSGAETFVRLFAQTNDLAMHGLKLDRESNLKDVQRAFASGQVEAAIVWEPVLSQLLSEAVVNTLRTFHSSFFSDVSILSASENLATVSPETIGATLRGLHEAQRFYDSNRSAAQTIVGRRLLFTAAELGPQAWSKFQPGIGLSSVLISMMEQTEKTFMMPDRSLVETSGINLQQFLYPQGLRKIDESLVTYE